MRVSCSVTTVYSSGIIAVANIPRAECLPGGCYDGDDPQQASGDSGAKHAEQNAWTITIIAVAFFV